ncbi:cytochrome b-c1 complex subunit 8, partial [Salmonella sp. S146_54837]|uniref:cytochrome b-c1 complex subunit 8 n=1 Tax=Salmonella sp. S146_54837 TaxID=2665635 RepID=UPI001CA81F6B
ENKLFTMGKHFGNVGRYSNIITFSLSPFEQKAFAGYFRNGFPNLWRRFTSKVFIVTPPFLVAYLVYTWGNKENTRLKRKQPGQFDNE